MISWGVKGCHRVTAFGNYDREMYVNKRIFNMSYRIALLKVRGWRAKDFGQLLCLFILYPMSSINFENPAVKKIAFYDKLNSF